MRKIIDIAPVIFVCLMLAGCGGSESQAKKAVLDVLKDPDSAKFGEFTQVSDDFACLTVNSKNSMGGYTGKQQAQLRKNRDGKWQSDDITEISHDSCILIPELLAQAEAAEAKAEAALKNMVEAKATYLAKNKVKAGVVTTASGLQYEVLTAGAGPKPSADDTVEVHYRGTLVDGTEFDSSYSRGESMTLGVGQFIPGWVEALQLMPKGSKWKLAIPPELAYGAAGAGNVIGPNETLIFEVQLIAIPSQDSKN